MKYVCMFLQELFLVVYCLAYLHRCCLGDAVGSIKLVTDSKSNYEGRVEIFFNDQWGSIDNRDIDDTTASVICRLLGLGEKGFEIDNYVTRNSSVVVFSYLLCNGNERDILDCRYSIYSSLHISDGGAGVICKELDTSSVRLHGGNDSSEGTVQFMYDGIWMRMCEDYLNVHFYHAVCRTMGYDVVEGYDINTNTSSDDTDLLPFVYLCNLYDHVLDGCDNNVYSERNCTIFGRTTIKCSHYQIEGIRLVGGNDSSEGRVELYEGEWKTVCSLGFSSAAFDAICRVKGFTTAMYTRLDPDVATGPLIPYQFYCSTYQSRINDCAVRNMNYTCNHSYDVFVRCSDFQIQDVQLVDGPTNSSGRVEFLIDDRWMTYCDSVYRADVVDVICRMEGYRAAKMVYFDAYYGEGVGDVVKNYMRCSSTQTDLNNCYNIYYTHYTCSHGDDLSVDCTDLNITDTRLVNGSNRNEGRIELQVDGEWKTVCDTTFIAGYATDTLCKSMGYKGVVEILRDAYFGQGTGDIVSHYFSCNADAGSLKDCNVRYSEDRNCWTHSNDLSVICSDLQIEDIRLVDGQSSLEGRVELLVDGEWRTVCQSNWNTNDQIVLCKSLGFLGRQQYYYNAYFGEGSGKILHNDFECTGLEPHLKNCSIRHRGNLCQHSHDFSIRCIACGDISIPTNGHITISGTSHGDFARFDCRPGYGLIGSALRVCTTNNTWNGTEAQCVKDCGDTPAPQNGSVVLPPQTIYTATVTYQCDPGFDLVGHFNRTCLENGTWGGSSPICEIKDCGRFEPPQNGTVDFSSGTVYTSIATLECDSGFTLYGEQTRECLQDGKWGGINPLCLVTAEDVTPENNVIKDALLYGGIAVALIVGITAGIIVAVYVLRKRLRASNGRTTSQTNAAYGFEDTDTADDYESITKDDMDSRNSAHDYEINRRTSANDYLPMDMMKQGP